MKKLLLFITLVTAFLAVGQGLAHAVDPFEEVCRDNPDNSVCNTSTDDPVTGKDSVIPKIANIVALVGGIIAVIVIIVSGVELITSAGDSAKLTKARDTIIYSAVGILIIVIARVIVQFIMGFV